MEDTDLDYESSIEPLEKVGRSLGLSEAISTDSSIVHTNYLDEDEEPLSGEQAVSQYFYKRTGERESIAADTVGKGGSTIVRGLQWRDKKNYCLSLDLDRQLADEYSNLTTVLISLRVQRGVYSRVTLLQELREAFDDMLRNKLEYALDTTVDSWEWVAVFAGTDKYATPHVHLYIIADGDVGIDTFRPSVKRFARECEYAPSDGRGNQPDDGSVRIMGRDDDTIPRRDDGVSAGMAYVSQQLAHLPDVEELDRGAAVWGSTVRAWTGGNHFRKSGYNVWDEDETESGRFDFSMKPQCKSKVSDYSFKQYADETCGNNFHITRFNISA